MCASRTSRPKTAGAAFVLGYVVLTLVLGIPLMLPIRRRRGATRPHRSDAQLAGEGGARGIPVRSQLAG